MSASELQEITSSLFYVIIVLIEVCVALYVLSFIFTIIGEMFGFSMKKALYGFAGAIGVLALKDFIKHRKNKAKEDIVNTLSEDDFEIIGENSDNE